MPRLFYESASFGLTAYASSTDPYDDGSNASAVHVELEKMLRNESMEPRPSSVYPWKTYLGSHSSQPVDGFVVQYKLEDLMAWRAAKRVNRTKKTTFQMQEGPLQAHLAASEYNHWHEAQHLMEKIARKLDQLLIVSWTPHHWAYPHPDDDLKHCHILQQIHPVRSGYQHLRESAVVWSI